MSDQPNIQQPEEAPAQVYTAEEYKQLVERGEAAIDARGRLRPVRPSGKTEGGVNLRKRRAWFAQPTVEISHDAVFEGLAAMRSKSWMLHERNARKNFWVLNRKTAQAVLCAITFEDNQEVPTALLGTPVVFDASFPDGRIELRGTRHGSTVIGQIVHPLLEVCRE